MHRVNLTVGYDEIVMIIASLYGKHTAESRQLAARLKVVRDQHKAMFGNVSLYGRIGSSKMYD